MKKVLMSTLCFILSAANASAVTCNTVPSPNSRDEITTTVQIYNVKAQSYASISTSGGFAHFITKPLIIPVTASNFGPEVVEYANSSAGFLLEVTYQPMNGAIHGNLTLEQNGARVQSPVVCAIELAK